MRNVSSKLAVISLVVAAATATADPITTATLLREMVDLQRLTKSPTPTYDTVQFSSYDRRSKTPGGPDWFANSDGFGNEPQPNFAQVLTAPDDDGVGEYLVCDVQGPGAIVRTWTAAHNGDYRVYLDGSTEPLYDGPADAFLRCPYDALRQTGRVEFDAALLAGSLRQNMAGYCPMPFAKGCRIVWRGKLAQVHFYQIQIRRYADGAEVATFTPADIQRYDAELQRTHAILTDPAEAYPYANTHPEQPLAAQVAPQATVELAKLDGPAAVERLRLLLRAADRERALRQTILKIYCDNHTIPQVAAPLGDFFGAAPGVNPFDSLPFTVRPDGEMTCRYVMPFAHSWRLVAQNLGDQPVTISGGVLPTSHVWDDNDSLHLRARWRVDHDLVGSPTAAQDLPYLCAVGRGRFVGAAMMLLNPVPIASAWGSWWGEGDEKIFVDDDVQPSTFGTGSEDYYNYAWSSPDIFAHAYCGQPRNDGPGNRGFVTNQRWQILDDLPFAQRFAFYMELLPHHPTPGMSYARLAYHYAAPATTDDFVRITADDVRPLSLPADWRPLREFALRGASIYEAEAIAQTTGILDRDRNPLWTGNEALTWRPNQPGDTLDLHLIVPETGAYSLHLVLALHPDSGRVRFTLDGQPLNLAGAAERDLYVPHRLLARRFSSDHKQLTKGAHVLTLEFVAAGPGVSQPVIAVDFAAVKPE